MTIEANGSKLLDFEKPYRERVINSIVNEIGSWNKNADQIGEVYAKLMNENPRQAIRDLSKFIDQARDINPERSFVEAIAGGPNHDWTAPMLDIVGTVYPSLEKDVRKEALHNCLDFLDGLRYDYSQNHVELINEPWLVGDIVITRPLYWCGFQDYCDLLAKHKTWKDTYPEMKNAKSAFWLAMAVVRTEFASDEVKERFYRLFPTLTDRTLDAIAGITYEHSVLELKEDGTPLEQNIEQRLFKYDHRFHTDIRRKIEERKWLKLAI